MTGYNGYTHTLQDDTQTPDESAMVRYVRAPCAHESAK